MKFEKVAKCIIPEDFTATDAENLVSSMVKEHIYKNKQYKNVENVIVGYEIEDNILYMEFKWEAEEVQNGTI